MDDDVHTVISSWSVLTFSTQETFLQDFSEILKYFEGIFRCIER